VQVCSPSTGEAKAGLSRVQGQPGQHRMTLSQKDNTKKCPFYFLRKAAGSVCPPCLKVRLSWVNAAQAVRAAPRPRPRRARARAPRRALRLPSRSGHGGQADPGVGGRRAGEETCGCPASQSSPRWKRVATAARLNPLLGLGGRRRRRRPHARLARSARENRDAPGERGVNRRGAADRGAARGRVRGETPPRVLLPRAPSVRVPLRAPPPAPGRRRALLRLRPELLRLEPPASWSSEASSSGCSVSLEIWPWFSVGPKD
jgi:hypothetical protein